MSWLPPVLTRRTVLTVSGLAAVGGCASSEQSRSSSGGALAARSDAARDRALAAEADLLARYDAALALPAVAADAVLTAKLTTIRAEHASHAAAIKDGYDGGPTPASSASTSAPTPTSAPTSASASGRLPSDPKAAVAALVRAEQEAAGARIADVLAADGGTAMLLASVAASESGHAALLLGGAA